MSTISWIIIGAVVIILLIIVSMYNRLIGLKNKVDYANGALDAMFKKRYDLIPNLVMSVKQYMEHETGLLTDLTNIRTQSQNNNLTEEQRDGLNKQLDSTLHKFNISVENYPNIKASEQFSMLQASLNECEGQLAAARRTYNASIMEFNNAVEMFPSSIIAKQMKYATRQMISIPEVERQNVNIKELFN